MHVGTYEIPRTGKSVETEREVEVTRGWEKGIGIGELSSFGVSLWGNEKVLEIDKDDDCTPL